MRWLVSRTFWGRQRSLRSLRVGLLLVLVLMGRMPLGAEETFSGPNTRMGSGVEIDLVQLLSRNPGYGFAPVRITIRNESGKDRAWNFEFSTEQSDDPDFVLKNSRSIEVEDGKTKTVDILVPLPGLGATARSGELRVNVSGYGVEYPGGQPPSSWANDPGVFVGFSQDLFTKFEGPAKAAFKERGYPSLDRTSSTSAFILRRSENVASRSSDRELTTTPLNFQKLPADWRSYSSLGGIFVSGQEWRDMPKAQEQALQDWMALGGRLMVLGAGEGTAIPVGFGSKTETVFTPENEIPAVLAGEALKLDADPALPWKADFVNDWGLVKAMGPLTVNTGLIIGFVVVFAIVIAPINLFFFAPLRARHRLFWTVPLISVAASLLLAVVIILQDGFGGSGARFTAVLLLPEEHKMVVIQEQVAKTALLLSQEFVLSEKILLAGVPTKHEGVPDGTVSRQEDQAGGDWFSSRTIKGYQLKAILPTRARIEVVGRTDDGTPLVLSSLPVNLRDFNLVESDGKTWQLSELKTGERTALKPGDPKADGIRQLLKDKASANLQRTLLPVLDRKGYFYALADKGGGVPLETLDSIFWREDYIIYAGAWTEAKP